MRSKLRLSRTYRQDLTTLHRIQELTRKLKKTATEIIADAVEFFANQNDLFIEDCQFMGEKYKKQIRCLKYQKYIKGELCINCAEWGSIVTKSKIRLRK